MQDIISAWQSCGSLPSIDTQLGETFNPDGDKHATALTFVESKNDTTISAGGIFLHFQKIV